MNSRALGSTGLRISEVAFGGVEIGMPYGISSGGRIPTADEAIYLLHVCLWQ